jgi:colicin import membrane protein
MKKVLVFLFPLLLAATAMPLWAQTTAAIGNTDLAAERARLTRERAAADQAFTDQRGVCFKRFAVAACLEESRRHKRALLDDIKRQETIINDAERKRRGGEALDRLAQTKAEAGAKELKAQRDKAIQPKQDRDQRAADYDASRAATTADEEKNRRQFDARQHDHVEQQATEARRRAEAPAQEKRFDDKLKQAEAHRAEVEKRLAARTKPRAARLPPPSP